MPDRPGVPDCRLAILGGDDSEKVDPLFHLGGAVAEHLQGRVVGVVHLAVEVRVVDPDGQVIGELAIPGFACPKGPLGLLLLGDIEGRDDDPLRRIVRIERRHTQKDVDRGSVLAFPSRLRFPDSVLPGAAVKRPAHPQELLFAFVEEPGGPPAYIILAVARHALIVFVGELKRPFTAEGNPHGHGFQDALQHGLAFPQSSLRFLEGADVRDDTHQARHLAVLRHGFGRQQSGEAAPVLPDKRIVRVRKVLSLPNGL